MQLYRKTIDTHAITGFSSGDIENIDAYKRELFYEMGSKTKIKCENQQRIHTGTSADKNSGTKNTVGHVTVPMKTDLNADIFKSVL